MPQQRIVIGGIGTIDDIAGVDDEEICRSPSVTQLYPARGRCRLPDGLLLTLQGHRFWRKGRTWKSKKHDIINPFNYLRPF